MLVANGATPEQDGFWRAREVYAFVGDADLMGKASHGRMQQRAGRSRDRLADLVCSLIACSIWEDVKCNRREARGGQEAAPIGSGGARRWSRVTLGSAGASGTCHVASYGRRRAHITPFCYRKKNVCNGRPDGRLGGRDYDICGLKSSSIPPVRSLEAWGAQPSELRTPRNDRNPALFLRTSYPTVPSA